MNSGPIIIIEDNEGDEIIYKEVFSNLGYL